MSTDPIRTDDDFAQIRQLTTQIVAAYVSNSTLESPAVAALIRSVSTALSHPSLVTQARPEPLTIQASPFQIRKSITPDALISFVDGRPYKALKRHLSKHGLSIAQYRSKYGLPDNYPTTAANYSQARSAMAKSFGLGRGKHARSRRA